MWDKFFLEILLLVIILYIPGFLILRATKRSIISSILFAPLLDATLYSVVFIAFGSLGIQCSWITTLLPILSISFAIFLISQKCFPDNATNHLNQPLLKTVLADYLPFFAYLIVGIIATGFIVIKNFDGPDSFLLCYDNLHHLNLTATFVASGNWSSIGPGFYSEMNLWESPFYYSTGFYPSLWHGLCALCINILGVSTPLSENALNTFFAGIVFPLSSYCLIKALFPKKRSLHIIGAFIVPAFAAFPWRFFIWELSPNMAAFCLVPLYISCFIYALDNIRSSNGKFALILFFVSSFGLATLHSNAIFAAAVFLAPYCIVKAYQLSNQNKKLTILVTLAIVAIWFGCFIAPPLQSVVSYSWKPYGTIPSVTFDVVTFAFKKDAPHYMLLLLFVFGCIALLKSKQNRWLVFPSLFMLVASIVCGSTQDNFLKHFLTGFWYTDPYRIAACFVVFAIPVTSMGAFFILSEIKKKLASDISLNNSIFLPKTKSAIIPIISVVILLFIYCPNITIGDLKIQTPIGSVSQAISKENNMSSKSREYTNEEQAFVKKALSMIPDSSLILNEASDGSPWSYGADGANLYYRYMSGYGKDSEQDTSKIIRTSLYNIYSNKEVQNAVKSTGAEYVLLLDLGFDNKQDDNHVNIDQWKGFDMITDQTPGFEMVLAEKDMRLYKITCLD